MIVEVDQSIKIEQTNHDTALAFSDGIRHRILVPARVKREAISYLRTRGKYAKRLYLWLFVLALYHLLKDYLNQLTVVVVDVEYPGNEENIKGLLLHLLHRRTRHLPRIICQRISRRSAAHKAAIAVIRGDVLPDRVQTTREFLQPISAEK